MNEHDGTHRSPEMLDDGVRRDLARGLAGQRGGGIGYDRLARTLARFMPGSRFHLLSPVH